MTLWDVFVACLRRWPVIVVGAILTLSSGYALTRDQGVYWTRTEVVLLAPASRANPNALNTVSGDLIITAGVVAKRIVGPEKIVKYSSPDATIVGASGVRDGYWIRLPDTGGQWATNFASQVLFVEIVAPTSDRVREQQQILIERIADALIQLQDEQNVPEEARITITVSPQSTVIYQVRGSRPRALVMVGVLGVAATVALVVVLEFRVQRRYRHALQE